MRPPTGRWVSSTSNTDLAAEAQRALIADLAPALGVERRSVEDDLGLRRGVADAGGVADRRQLVVFDAVAHDRHDLGVVDPRRLVADERAVAATRLDRLVQRRRLGVPGELGLLARARSLALLAEGHVEARPVDPDAVLGRELDRQVDREAVGVVEAERDVAGEDGRVSRQVLGPEADHQLGRRQRDERLLELDRARIEGPGELGLLADDRAEDLGAPLGQVRIGLVHDVDDDRGQLGEERLPPSEEPSVANRAAQDPAEDVAAPLVRREHAVADEEGDRPRVVGDDLVAEPFLLECVRVMPEQLTHPGVDRHEQVRVVVARDLLEDARQALEPETRVDARERQRVAAVGPLVELHEHEVPELDPAGTGLGVIGQALGSLGQVRAAIEMDLAARSAWAGVRHPPEVLVVAELDVAPLRHLLRAQPDLVAPDVPGDLVVGVGRRGETVGRQTEILGQEVHAQWIASRLK